MHSDEISEREGLSGEVAVVECQLAFGEERSLLCVPSKLDRTVSREARNRATRCWMTQKWHTSVGAETRLHTNKRER